MEQFGTRAHTAAPQAVSAFSQQSGSDMFRPIAPYWHTLLVLVVLCTIAYRGKIRIEQLLTLADPNRIRIYESTILFELAVFGLVLAGVWFHGSPLRAVLGARWHSPLQLLRDVGIGMMFLVVTIAMGSILGHGAGNPAARMILPRGRAEMELWIVLSITAGICEEAIYRGYLQRQFIAVTGNVAVGIVLSAIAFGASHIYQGLAAALQIAMLGALGGILAYWCKSVRPGMIAHILQDVLGGLVRH